MSKAASRVLALDTAIGFLPAALDLRLEHRAPGRGIVRGLALGQAERGVGIQRVAGHRLPGRIALVEQGGDLRSGRRSVPLRLRRLRRWLAAWACGFGGGFFSSFFSASAIGSTLGGSGFFSIGFGSSFGLASATGFGGSGFFSTGFSSASAAAAARCRSRPAASR